MMNTLSKDLIDLLIEMSIETSLSSINSLSACRYLYSRVEYLWSQVVRRTLTTRPEKDKIELTTMINCIKLKVLYQWHTRPYDDQMCLTTPDERVAITIDTIDSPCYGGKCMCEPANRGKLCRTFTTTRITTYFGKYVVEWIVHGDIGLCVVNDALSYVRDYHRRTVKLISRILPELATSFDLTE